MLINWGSCKRFLICMSGILFLTGVMTVTEVAAQVNTGTILGTVTDPSGAVVPGAMVRVKNTGTGTTQNAVTSGQGRYTVADLPIGTYDVQAAMKGFQTVIHSDVTLTVGSQMVVDFSLPVGQSEQTVTVQAAAAQVETTTSSLANLVEQKQMVELPLNGRNFQQLMTLAPGVLVSQSVNSNFYGKGDMYTVAGGRPEGQGFLLDGQDITNYFNKGTGSGVLGTSLGIDAIAEFELLTNTYSAQFGGSGSVMNAASKSGTNQFHGSGFEFIRNSALDARNHFDLTATGAPAPVPPFRRNQFGGTLGGPIKKDKAFFFFNYEGLRSSLSSTQFAYVPDANARNGYLCIAGAPASPSCAAGSGLVNVGVNANVAAALALYPATTATSPTNIVKVPQVAADASHENYVLARVDYVFSQKDSLFGRFVSDRSNYTNPFPYANVPLWPDLEESPNLYFTANERHIFSANLINTLRGGYVRTDSHAVTLNSYPGMNFFPGSGRPDGALQVAGLSNTGGQGLDPYRTLQNKVSVSDDAYWNKGAHSLKFGVAFQSVQTLEYNPYLIAGLYIFNGFNLAGPPVSPLQAFLQDQAYLFVGPSLDPTQDKSYHWYHEFALAPYINDDWKITSKLTLNLGLRYDFNSNALCASHDCETLVHPLTDATYTPVNHAFAQNPSLRNFDPRIGVAYDPFQDHKTSIRGGFGIFHDVLAARQWSAGFASSPPFNVLTKVFPCFPNPFGACGFAVPPLPTGIVSTYYGTDATPYQMEWNVNVQREIFRNTILTVGYIGAHSNNLIVQRDLNPPTVTVDAQGVEHFGQVIGGQLVENPRLNPNVNAYNAGVADGDSSYNSLQVNLTHRFVHNVEAQAAYTYSKCTDITSGTSGLDNGGQPVQDPYHPSIDRGPCAFDIPQALRINTIVSLPFHGNRFVEGWQVSGILSATSGPPFSPLVGFDSAGYFNQGSIYPMERPNMAAGRTCNDSLVTGNPNHWFDTSAFTVPAPGTFGNAPRNCMRAPGLFNADFAVSKETKVSEGFRIQFRAEFFNIFNHTNFQQPIIAGGGGGSPYNLIFNADGTPNTTSAGVITATSTTSRQIQFGVKLLF